MDKPLLEVERLSVEFQAEGGFVRAVQEVSFAVGRGETLGIVGESGSGKSVSTMALLGLVPMPPARVTSGRALFNGQDLLQLGEAGLRPIRGQRIAVIFQDPMTSLNPFMTVGEQVAEPLRVHLGLAPTAARMRAIDLLEQVGIENPGRRVDDFPHQFSGGMRQRVMIAMALACGPDLLIADEPTTALDVTVQAQILQLLKKLQKDHGMGILLITHDLGIVADMCHRVNVMYAGRVVESATTADLFARPLHPYTQGLQASVPRLDAPLGGRLASIGGTPPNPARLPPGCAFGPRCPHRETACEQSAPPLVEVGSEGQSHRHACRRQSLAQPLPLWTDIVR